MIIRIIFDFLQPENLKKKYFVKKSSKILKRRCDRNKYSELGLLKLVFRSFLKLDYLIKDVRKISQS